MDNIKFVKRILSSEFKVKKTKLHRNFTIYLNEKSIKALEILQKNNINIAKICRYAIEDMAEQVEKSIDKSINKE